MLEPTLPWSRSNRATSVSVILSCGEACYRFFPSGHYVKGMVNNSQTSVLYNSECPVCSAEVGHYVRYVDEAALPIRFDDLSTNALEQWGLDHDTAARRLYVQRDGMLTSGVPAFLVLWAQMPRYRLLGQILGLPGIRQIASAAYDHCFAPALYRAHLRRLRNKAARTAN